MRERTEKLQGTFRIESAPNQGSKIWVQMLIHGHMAKLQILQ